MAEEAELIGGRIRELRENCAWTQRELAEKMEGHAEGKDISRWENGKHVPEPSNLKALAEALETTVADLRAGPLAKRQEPKPEGSPLDALSEPASAAELDERLEWIESALQALLLERGLELDAPPSVLSHQPQSDSSGEGSRNG